MIKLSLFLFTIQFTRRRRFEEHFAFIDVHRGWGGRTPYSQIFKKLVNKNVIKPKIRDPRQFCPESLDPPGKNLSYPLSRIFNPCASMFASQTRNKFLRPLVSSVGAKVNWGVRSFFRITFFWIYHLTLHLTWPNLT